MNWMSEPIKNKSPRPILEFMIKVGLACILVGFVTFAVLPNHLRTGKSGPGWNANVCINNLRQLDAVKNEWALEHNAKSNDVVTINDIRPYIEQERNNSYIKLDAKGNLPKCPSGGTYANRKVGEPPTCSLGTNVNPPHVLQ
jgi:hypothetical protein